ncbi:MAG: DICT sensory domain-containing protein [Haloglomus sp.]
METVEASLGGFVERFRDERGAPTITTHGPAVYDDLHRVLERFDATVEHEYLSVPESAGYLTVDLAGERVGSVPASAFDDLLDPPRRQPWDRETRESGFRTLTSLLAGVEFRNLGKPHLLSVSREFEDRAWHAGRGTLHAGFQSLTAFRYQIPVFGRLDGATDLTVRVYAEPDWVPPEPLGFEVRTEAGGELGRYWLLALDDGDEMACALLAEETRPGRYSGVWTYDADAVRDLSAYLDETYR